MYKQNLLDTLVKEMKIVQRLSTKIPVEQINYRPKEGMRSMLELLQYLTHTGTGFIMYWYRADTSDLKTFYAPISAKAKTLTHEQFIPAMDHQIEKVQELFSNMTDDEFKNKTVDYPWGGTAPLCEAILTTSVRWLIAYKMQLFLYIKMTSDQKLGTPDVWRLTDLAV
jgi:hypothetical protein